MPMPWHKPEVTTNVASVERKDTRRVKAAIRVDDAKTIRDVRDWRDERKREGDGN